MPILLKQKTLEIWLKIVIVNFKAKAATVIANVDVRFRRQNSAM
jgi:hypothetical protein